MNKKKRNMKSNFFREHFENIEPEGKERWNNFLNEIDAIVLPPKILWYPSAGTDLRDLLHLHPQRFTTGPRKGDAVFKEYPDIYLHTDCLTKLSDFFKKGNDVHRDKRTHITTSNVVALRVRDLDLNLKPELVDFPNACESPTKAILVDLDIESDILGKFKRSLIYIFAENAAFFSGAVLEHKLHISHLVHIRDGELLGGGRSGAKFLWYFLSRMKTQYLLTDGMGRSAAGIKLVLENYPAIRKAFISPDNHQVIFTGKKQLTWSNYGIFLGDALIFKIEHFPGSLSPNNRQIIDGVLGDNKEIK